MSMSMSMSSRGNNLVNMTNDINARAHTHPRFSSFSSLVAILYEIGREQLSSITYCTWYWLQGVLTFICFFRRQVSHSGRLVLRESDVGELEMNRSVGFSSSCAF